MLTTRLRLTTAFAAAGAAFLLSACSTTGSASSTPTSPASQAAQAQTTAALNLVAGTAKSNGATPGQGDWAMPNGGVPDAQQAQAADQWVQLTAATAGDLNPVVINGAHLTLYRFDNDKPDVSTCYGTCATQWPPVVVQPTGKVFVAGVKPADIGFTKRTDGQLQITIAHHPIYRFAQDTEPGDTKGEGVGGTWYGVQPNGDKALGSGSGSSQAPQVIEGTGGTDNSATGSSGTDGSGTTATGSGTSASTQTTAATRAVFFDDKNFADNGSQAVSEEPGNTCSNLSRPNVASSVAVQGSIKLWQGPGCTGKSMIINGDVADLGTIGFDNLVTSVRFLG